MIELFINNTGRDLVTMEKAIQNEDAEGTKKIAHALKSTVLIFGLNTINERLVEIETIEFNQEKYRKLITDIKDSIKTVTLELTEILSSF